MTHPRRDIVAFLALMLVVLLVRFQQVESVEFYHDEAMVSMMAQEMAHGETFPLVGILSSVGIPNPPAAIYVMAVPFTFTSDPVIATAYVSLLNVIGIALLYCIARREFGLLTALVAALIFTLNPWALMYSRKIWAQDYVNPFLLLALVAALWGYKDGKRWGQLFALPLMLFAMQIHFAAWALVPLFAWIGWSGRRNIRRGAVLLSLVLGVLVMLPYLVGLAQTLQADPTRIVDTLGRDGVTGKTPFDALRYAAQLAVGLNIESWLTPGIDITSSGVPPVLLVVASLICAALLLAGSYTVARYRPAWRINFVLWIIVPIVAFQIGLSDIWPHYFVPLLPAFALLAACGVTAISNRISGWPERQRHVARLLLISSGVVSGLIPALHYQRVSDFAYTHDIPISTGTSGYTTPMFILGAVRDAIPAEIDDVLVLTNGDRVWFDAEAARWPVMLRDSARCVRTLSGDGFFVQPASESFAVIHTPTASANHNSRYTSSYSVTIAARQGEGDYIVTINRSQPSDRSVQATFSNGVSLIGWHAAGERVELHFRLPAAPDRTFYGALHHDYQYFVHLLDADGNRIGQRDASFWPGRHWCAEDQLSVLADIPGAKDAVTLRLGFYRLLDAEVGTTEAVDILDAAGNAAGNWVDIPLERE